VADDADTDVVKIIVSEVSHVVSLLAQRMAFVAAGASVEQLPPSLRAFVNRILVTGYKMIERRIE